MLCPNLSHNTFLLLASNYIYHRDSIRCAQSVKYFSKGSGRCGQHNRLVLTFLDKLEKHQRRHWVSDRASTLFEGNVIGNRNALRCIYIQILLPAAVVTLSRRHNCHSLALDKPS